MADVVLRGFGWRHAGRRAWAVRGVDLHIAHGERVLLLGESGAGKSTLLAALAGLLPSDSGEAEGEVRVDGRAGILFQDPQTQLVMARSGDDVAFGPENHGVPADDIWPRVRAALDRVGFPYPLDRPTAALSGGEAQRLALAGVLALRPGLLLLDEPTANLDPDGAALIRDAVARSLGRDTTLILVEHRVAEALPLVDRVVVLEAGGGIRADGPPGAVFAAHGDALAAQGVWVPGRPVAPRRAVAGPAGLLVRSDGVTVRNRLPATGLDVRAGEVVAVTGPNGAGKSTLALTLAGLRPPAGGELTAAPALAGDLGPHPHRWRARDLVSRIGTVFQDPRHQFLATTVADELELGPRRAGLPDAEVTARRDALLERLRLAPLAKANPFTLSGGEQRRLSVATVLATRPRLLVLDEPTFGQDARTWAELVALLRELTGGGAALVVATHDDDLVTALDADPLVLGTAVPA
jgi:energy-coupling factor transporter ATP-binding protein EcfA2